MLAECRSKACFRLRTLVQGGLQQRDACRLSCSHDSLLYYPFLMAFPLKVCAVCEEEFELKPDKPGFANRCPECSEDQSVQSSSKGKMDADERKSLSEANEARRQAMRNLLYRKDS